MSATPTMQLPAWLLRLFTAVAVVLGIAGALAGVSFFLPWIDDTMYSSVGPIGTLGVVLGAAAATDLLRLIGPQRWSERRAFRARRQQARAGGLTGRRVTAAALIPYPAHTRARRAIVGGVVAGFAGLLERVLVTYNVDSITGRGLETGAGVDLANVVVATLFVCAGVALIGGVVGMFVPLAPGGTFEVPAGFATPFGAPSATVPSSPVAPARTPAVWTPTHRVPDGGMPAFETPEAAVPLVMLDALLPLVVIEHRGERAAVRAENGWQGWVRSDGLVPLAIVAPVPPMPVG
ncbi:MAG TPA: hypothetical protein VF235_04290 [Actinomycetota bacterium]